jgi:hypothetical protein
MAAPKEKFPPAEAAPEEAEKEPYFKEALEQIAFVEGAEGGGAERRFVEGLKRAADKAKAVPDLAEKMERMAREMDEEAERAQKRRQGLVRKWVARAMLGLALAGGVKIGMPEREPEAIERVQMIDAPVKDVIVGHAEAEAPETIEFQGREIDREALQAELDEAINAGMRERYSGIADTCSGAEQCYLYYNDQINFKKPEIIAAAAGRSVEELKFASRVIQDGFKLSAGLKVPGAVVGRVEAGKQLFPGAMLKERRDAFYAETYRELLDYVYSADRAYALHALSGAERAEAVKRLAALIHQETITRIMYRQAEAGYANYTNSKVRKSLRETRLVEGDEASPLVPKAYKKAVDDRAASEGEWFAFLREHSPAFKNVPADEAEGRRGAAALAVAREHYAELQHLFASLGWKERADEWRERVADMDARIKGSGRGPGTAVAKAE